MQNGYSPASVIEDKEEEFSPGWKPQNSDRAWHGKVSLRTALVRSMNVPTVKLAQEVGVSKIINNAEKWVLLLWLIPALTAMQTSLWHSASQQGR